MKLRSFRLRIALLSAILAGSALVGFGLISSWLIYDAKVSRLDVELESQLFRAARRRGQNNWELYVQSLPLAFGTNSQTPIAIRVIDTEKKTLYQSSDWSPELEMQRLLPFRPFRKLPPIPTSNRQSSSSSRDRRPSEPPKLSQFVTQRTTKETWRVGAIAGSRFQVTIAVSLSGIDREMALIRNIFLISIPILFLLVVGGAWGLSGSSLRSIRGLTDVIQHVTVTGLGQRVPIDGMDVEFVELIQVFNQMLERLERSFNQASRFSADAAHELKTPLAILQGTLEQTLQQVEPGSEVQQSLSNLLDEVRRLSGIVRKLLLLSLADAGRMNLYRVDVNLSQLLIEMTEDIELLAPDLNVQTDIASGLHLRGDRDLLTQILQNLISNAIKYNLPEGWIGIHGHQQEKTVLVTISNSSKDIPPKDRERIFDRFYRSDPARTRKVDGIGLGLSLAREIAKAHDGDLTLDPTPSGLTAFTLSLPIL
ncbi:MAG: ATP-binding protein [Scytonema sp. PMC 1069.18]|nr:ATP-binding protein [Scytonema sp. PMC 1069.18]MEC4882980.1 ATP-binding protein [Scytonema sp. PMC 1070.18]